jgi:two-component system NtrC family sensor kinase
VVLRLAVFLTTAIVVCVSAGSILPGLESTPGQGALCGFVFPVLATYAALTLLGSLIGRRRLESRAPGLLFLAGDVLAIGALGTGLCRGAYGGPDLLATLPFLAAYLVAVLVAVMGRRWLAGVLAGLAGAMVMGLGAAMVAVVHRDAPDLVLLSSQLFLLVAASIEAALMTGWLEAEETRRRTTERIERELKAREAEAGELVTFTQSLVSSGSLQEIAEAVVRHVRCHLPVRARAVAIESKGDVAAIWEEAGRLEPDHVERRRQRLQESLMRAGSNHVLSRMEARSALNKVLPQALDFHTLVEVPIQVGGRVAGVVLVADPGRGAVAERRIGILADLVRRTGDAILRIERRAEEEQRRTAVLLRQMHEGVVLFGADGQVLVSNPAAREMLQGAESSELLPTHVGDVPVADLVATPPGVTRRFRAEVRPLGAHRPVLLACTAVATMDAGKRVGTLVTLTDVTEEELARGRLVQSEKMTLVGQTLAGVAHELNNPLAALIGYADLLEARELSPELERPVRQMREQALRAARIVRNLLNFAKQRNPERLPTRMGDLVQAVVELFAYEIRLANITITSQIEPELPPVLGDKHSLQQILVNVLQNAIHVLQEHEGERRIEIVARAVADAVLVSVQDSGPGVPLDFRVRVFEPFFTTKGANRGTGLGLALSRTIARDHGGDLGLEPDQGKGACFMLRLPLPRASDLPTPAAPALATREGVAPGSPFNILVVDDEPAVREALVAQLGRMGCRVDSAANATEAGRQILRNEYDAVLLDVRMPGGSGLDLHQRLTQEKPAAVDRIVFMTGDFANDEVLGGIRRTGNPFLEKPFTLDELSRALQGRPGAPVPDAFQGRAVTIGAN